MAAFAPALIRERPFTQFVVERLCGKTNSRIEKQLVLDPLVVWVYLPELEERAECGGRVWEVMPTEKDVTSATLYANTASWRDRYRPGVRARGHWVCEHMGRIIE